LTDQVGFLTEDLTKIKPLVQQQAKATRNLTEGLSEIKSMVQQQTETTKQEAEVARQQAEKVKSPASSVSSLVHCWTNNSQETLAESAGHWIGFPLDGSIKGAVSAGCFDSQTIVAATLCHFLS
jgi:hypothetical protein